MLLFINVIQLYYRCIFYILQLYNICIIKLGRQYYLRDKYIELNAKLPCNTSKQQVSYKYNTVVILMYYNSKTRVTKEKLILMGYWNFINFIVFSIKNNSPKNKCFTPLVQNTGFCIKKRQYPARKTYTI